jgi:hypothetical protein
LHAIAEVDCQSGFRATICTDLPSTSRKRRKVSYLTKQGAEGAAMAAVTLGEKAGVVDPWSVAADSSLLMPNSTP